MGDTGAAFALDENWNVPETDQIFLVFPDGQFDLRSVTLEPLSREQWIQQVATLMPGREIAAAAANAQHGEIRADIDPLPEVPLLLSAVLVQARSGNFDELERWAERLRSGEVVVDDKFVAEDLYQRLATAYVTPRPSGSHGGLEGFYQGQFAFIDEWLKQKPDSVAARIVKRALISTTPGTCVAAGSPAKCRGKPGSRSRIGWRQPRMR